MKFAELVSQHYKELSFNDLYIWDYIQARRKECQDLSIIKPAQRRHVSKTTILRSVQKLSLEEYSELKVYLSWENRPSGGMVTDKHPIEHICNTSRYVIDELQKRDFTDICEMLYYSGRTFVYGTGALQNSVARELQRIFLYCREFVYVLSDEKEAEMVLPFLSRDDIVILIPLRGEGELINEFISQLRLRGIKTIPMARPGNNELAHKYTKSIYIITSQMTISNYILYEVANLYFVLAELLFLRYSQYKQKQDGIGIR